MSELKLLPARVRNRIRRVFAHGRLGDADGSQAGEVRALQGLIDSDWPRALVDVGAFDGVTLSNSRPFIRDGWSALLVEPQPGPYARALARYRGNPRVVCVNKACSDVRGVYPLWLGVDGNDSMLSTLCTDENEYFATVRSGSTVEVEVDSLTSMLDGSGFPDDFSLLLVDAEGMDYEVLRGLDAERYRPRIVLTEQYRWNATKHARKHQLLTDRGYELRTIVGCNEIWIRAS
jgi:FkbM family methyltransferase